MINKIVETSQKITYTTQNYHPTRGLLSILFNQIKGSGSLVLGIVNIILAFIENQTLPKVFIELIGIFLILLAFIFVQNILLVGKNRYYIEHHKYKKSYIDKLFFVYRFRKTINVAYIMFIKEVYSLLWSLTIVGGIYKYYSYFMIPYVLAENPSLKTKEAFDISKNMMNGNKFKLFKLQISLFPLEILGVFTFNLSNIFFLNIYKESIYAEFYFEIRNNLISQDIKYTEIFKDRNLDGESILESYPTKEYFLPEGKKRKWLKLDFKRNYSIMFYILLFFSCSMIGWGWEVSLNFIMCGFFVNKGTMYGPWIPIYGYGAVAIVLLSKLVREKPWKLFCFSCLLCGIIEYMTGFYLETFKHMKWWDYSGFFLNIKGRVCLEGVLVFGLAGVICTYVLAPLFDNIFSKLNRNLRIIVSIFLLLFYIIDLIFSSNNPNSGIGITYSLMRLINLFKGVL